MNDPYHGQGGSYVMVDGQRVPADDNTGEPLPPSPHTTTGDPVSPAANTTTGDTALRANRPSIRSTS